MKASSILSLAALLSGAAAMPMGNTRPGDAVSPSMGSGESQSQLSAMRLPSIHIPTTFIRPETYQRAKRYFSPSSMVPSNIRNMSKMVYNIGGRAFLGQKSFFNIMFLDTKEYFASKKMEKQRLKQEKMIAKAKKKAEKKLEAERLQDSEALAALEKEADSDDDEDIESVFDEKEPKAVVVIEHVQTNSNRKGIKVTDTQRPESDGSMVHSPASEQAKKEAKAKIDQILQQASGKAPSGKTRLEDVRTNKESKASPKSSGSSMPMDARPQSASEQKKEARPQSNQSAQMQNNSNAQKKDTKTQTAEVSFSALGAPRKDMKSQQSSMNGAKEQDRPVSAMGTQNESKQKQVNQSSAPRMQSAVGKAQSSKSNAEPERESARPPPKSDKAAAVKARPVGSGKPRLSARDLSDAAPETSLPSAASRQVPFLARLRAGGSGLGEPLVAIRNALSRRQLYNPSLMRW